jgi:hypothetical protein
LLEDAIKQAEVADDSRCDEEDHEEDEEGEVEESVANDTTLAELGLLERVDGRADLTAVNVVSKRHGDKTVKATYLGRSQKSMTEWNLSM